MGLFDQVVGALNNPNQQANPGQLSGILDTVQQLAGGQVGSAANTQKLMSVVGSYVRSSLQDKRRQGGQDLVEDLIDQFAGTSPSMAALQSLFSQEEQQHLAEDASQKTGINAATVQAMLPVLVPLVLNFLKTGSSSQGVSRSAQPNSVLGAFLDSDGDGDVDMGDALSMASQFMRQG
ncbi:MAG: hypothetical protein VKK04_21295 [Synechococcales bacterium]|nr:hypothetical protein [Synechococcales bacterium]